MDDAAHILLGVPSDLVVDLSSVLLLARPRPHPPLRSNDASHAPPDASRIIFNIDLGPSVVRTTSLTALAAAMLFARAIDPVSREAF